MRLPFSEAFCRQPYQYCPARGYNFRVNSFIPATRPR
jgi:hypothetical protein